jgi:DNA integrity scanning protein DisA with diadenylate cyclase activity
MSVMTDKLTRLLVVLPVIISVALTNVVIAFAMAGLVFIQLISVYNWTQMRSLIAAILIAVAVHAYIYFQPNIRRYISARSQ